MVWNVGNNDVQRVQLPDVVHRVLDAEILLLDEHVEQVFLQSGRSCNEAWQQQERAVCRTLWHTRCARSDASAQQQIQHNEKTQGTWKSINDSISEACVKWNEWHPPGDCCVLLFFTYVLTRLLRPPRAVSFVLTRMPPRLANGMRVSGHRRIQSYTFSDPVSFLVTTRNGYP